MIRNPGANRRVSRRAFLGTSAVTVGLPFLDSLCPREAKAQDNAVRLVYWFVPNGLDMDTFRPDSTGEGYTTPPMLTPLESLRPDFSVVTGLENINGRPVDQGDHASGTSAFITCAKANKSQSDILLGISADQVAAQQFGNLTRLPSLQLGIQAGRSSGDCDSGYSCAYAVNISWANETTPLAKITDPQQAFNEIFQGYDPMDTDQQAEARTTLEQSVLDQVVADANTLSAQLAYSDRVKLDQYLTGVRELERRVANTASLSCDPGEAPPGGRLEYPDHVRILSDLQVLALQCDATRVITFMFGNALSGQTHPFLGIDGGHHDISHHQGDANKIAQLAQIGQWEMEQLFYFLNRLKEIPDGADGTSNLLTNSAVFLSSDISDGNRHNHDDLPVILAGHGGGGLNPGRHIAYPNGFRDPKEKMANLLVTMLEAAGVSALLGDSDGPLADL